MKFDKIKPYDKGDFQMKKIKDLIYNISDVLIAVLILAIASGVILWRMENAINYPKEVIKEKTEATEIILPKPEDFPSPEKEEENTEGENTDNPGNTGEVVELWVDGKLQGEVTVVLGNSVSSATDAVNEMIKAGLFESYAEYKSICKSLGKDDEKVRQGTYVYKPGLTKEDIVKSFNVG